MPSLATFKGPLMGLMVLVSYTNMVLDIIMITKVRDNVNDPTYPPAVVAMLVLSILQLLWGVYYFVCRGKTIVFRAKDVAIALAVCFCFNLGAIVATTVLRYDTRYCPATASNVGDCRGVMRGTMGLGFALLGVDLIYVGYVVALVTKFGAWTDEMAQLPPVKAPNADLEKAAGH